MKEYDLLLGICIQIEKFSCSRNSHLYDVQKLFMEYVFTAIWNRVDEISIPIPDTFFLCMDR